MKIKNILPVFSYIFHPIFISIYGSLYYFFITNGFYNPAQMYVMLIQISILTLFLPLSIYFLFRTLGVVSSFTEASLKERQMPIAIQAVLLVFLIKFSITKEVSTPLFYYFLGGLISAVLALLFVLMRFKVSLHLIGISALTIFIYGIGSYYQFSSVNIIAVFVILMGLVASSRLYMKAHTPKELIAGTLVGSVPQFILFSYW